MKYYGSISDGKDLVTKEYVDNAKFPNTVSLSSGVVILSADWGGKNVVSSYTNDIQFNSDIVSGLADGWECRIVSINSASSISWGPGVTIYDFSNGYGYFSAGSLGIPQNTYIDLKKIGEAITFSGNFVLDGTKLSGGSITGAKIANKTVEWDNLSDTGRFGNYDAIGTTGIVNLQPSWGGAVITNWLAGVEIHFDTSIVVSLPIGWRCRIHTIISSTALTWDAVENVYDLVNAAPYYNTAGSIAIPANRYIELQRATANAFIIMGNFADRNITSGTSAPSGGSNGDIYIQYS